MLKTKIILSLCLILLAACVSVTDKAAPIQVHSQLNSVLDKCKNLGPVNASVSSLNLDSQGALEVMLREATANLGGDSVAIIHSNSTLTQEHMQGIAFKCY